MEAEANADGHGVLVVNEEGTRLNGIWGFGDDLNKYGIWVFRKKSNSPSLCYADDRSAELSKKEFDAIVEQMKSEIEKKGKLIIYGINFETNSSRIKEESYSTLDEIYGLLHAHQQMKLNNEGHTDNIRSSEDNKKLSSSRAESVRNYLVSKGIDAQRLMSQGKGEEYPMADNSSQLGRAANRRVELKLQ